MTTKVAYLIHLKKIINTTNHQMNLEIKQYTNLTLSTTELILMHNKLCIDIICTPIVTFH